MRILKSVQFYFPFQDRGGPVFKIRALARGLVRNGHEVTVVTADLGLERNKFFGIPFERCEWGWKTATDGFEVIYLPTIVHYRALTINPKLWHFARARAKHFDLAHFYGLYDLFGPTLSHSCRRHKIPYVVEPIGMYNPIDRNIVIKRLWHKNLGNRYIKGASLLVATSEIERHELLDAGIPGTKIVVRYNGIDSATFAAAPNKGAFREKWRIPLEEPLILFLSRLIPRKNADMLIAAFARTCPTLGRLVIAGPEGVTGYLATLKAAALQHGIASRVIFTGPLYDSDKVAAMIDADVFVLPSLYENFANAPAEAIACGVPVIVSDRCGISEIVGGRAGVVISPNLDSLVSALQSLLNDPDLYDRLKVGCRAVAAELDWRVLSRQMEGSYKEVCDKFTT
jgi:glycosyltransferase involved in cell wall biosynthesis